MKTDSKIFVAGGSGMVGFAILRRLHSMGYSNILSSYNTRKPSNDRGNGIDSNLFIKINLTKQSDVEAFFNHHRPEYVFLAAAKVGGILANTSYKADFIYDNLMIASNVIQASYKHGAKKLLNLGSSCIYPKYAPQPMKENALLSGFLEPTNEPYAVAKIAAIKLCRYFNEQYGTDFISVMPTNLYGPNDNFDLETSHVLPALIRKFFLADQLWKISNAGFSDYELIQNIKKYKLGFNIQIDPKHDNVESIVNALEKVGITSECVTLWGSGEAFREFMYVDDLADACIFLMQKFSFKNIGEFINIGIGKDIQIKDLAQMISKLIGFKGHIRFDTSKPEGTPRKLLDVSRIHELGWCAKTTLEDGIRKTIFSLQSDSVSGTK